ncbi:MAG: DUF1476 domain-containing protein [Rhodospirillales bacterium]|nr:DUF1476 domain-containing protein [Rhodospirillales bacterium]MCW9001277.1 DUF1476 domain-containing protein [Rhodospirillales bacterium]
MPTKEQAKGHEEHHSRGQEWEFKVTARRNKLLGLWVADLLGITGDEAADYAKSVVIADLEEAGDEDVIRKVMADFAEHGSKTSEADVRAKLQELAKVARVQLQGEE